MILTLIGQIGQRVVGMYRHSQYAIVGSNHLSVVCDQIHGNNWAACLINDGYQIPTF